MSLIIAGVPGGVRHAASGHRESPQQCTERFSSHGRGLTVPAATRIREIESTVTARPVPPYAMSSAKKARHSAPTPDAQQQENGDANGHHPSAGKTPRCTYSVGKSASECPHVMVSQISERVCLRWCVRRRCCVERGRLVRESVHPLRTSLDSSRPDPSACSWCPSAPAQRERTGFFRAPFALRLAQLDLQPGPLLNTKLSFAEERLPR